MAALSRRSRTPRVIRDLEKERKFKQLVALLGVHGYSVRREKLKQGHGWKVVSGACTAHGQKMIFVDQRMTQDDQLIFLRSIAETAGLNLAEAGAPLEPHVTVPTEPASEVA